MDKLNTDFVNVVLPELGEGVVEATLIQYLVSVGDEIEEDQPIAEVSTDKVDTEIHSPYSGIVEKILYKENQVAKVGEPILILKPNNNEKEAIKIPESILPKELLRVPQNGHNEKKEEQNNLYSYQNSEESFPANLDFEQDGIPFLSPLVKSICKVESISEAELKKIIGTGKEGRITKNDLLAYLEKRGLNVGISEKSTDNQSVAIEVNLLEERLEMSRTRKLISQRMLASVNTSPHVTSFLETDVTEIVKWREKNKEAFEKENGYKITYLPIIIKAVVETLKEYPLINISVEGETIIKKNYINIGIATALESGELIVPIIKNADKLSVQDLGKEINDLVYRSRKGLLTSTDVIGGTYTVSNIGTFGNLFGTPIINQPQSAILAIGSIEKKPAVIETEHGDLIGIRHKMFLSHSYDHRVIDGYLGGSFLKSLSNRLENFSGI